MDIARFLQHLQFEKHFSPHTLMAYRKDLEQFRAFMEEQYAGLEFGQLDHFHLRSWVVRMVEDGLTPASIRRKVSAAKSFFGFLHRCGEIARNPMQYLFSPKVGKRLPAVVPEKPLLRMLEGYSESAVTFPELRDALAMELLYQTGMRRAELLQLTLDQTDTVRMELRIKGKGGKERIVPISAGLGKMIDRYLEARSLVFPQANNDKLLLTDKGEPLYPKWLYNLVHQRLGQVPGLDKRSPHVLRHSFATHLADHGADLNAIKTLLGHANLSSTEVYTHHTMDRLRRIYQQAHPKAKKDNEI